VRRAEIATAERITVEHHTRGEAAMSTPMTILFILNDAPYGSEKTYNALRLAMTIQHDQADADVRIFLMADAVTAALTEQQTPQGYYNLERMLRSIVAKGGQLGLCGTCCAARGITSLPRIEGATVETMATLAMWTAQADRVLVF
jgi:uncharacterized protein involved in oxidation of intracellular sulfur